MIREIDTAWVLELIDLCDQFGWRYIEKKGEYTTMEDILGGCFSGIIHFHWKHKERPHDYNHNKLFVLVNDWTPTIFEHITHKTDAFFCFGFEPSFFSEEDTGFIPNNDLEKFVDTLILLSYAKTNPKWWYEGRGRDEWCDNSKRLCAFNDHNINRPRINTHKR